MIVFESVRDLDPHSPKAFVIELDKTVEMVWAFSQKTA